MPFPRQVSRIAWSTDWTVQILEPAQFELTGRGFEASYVAIYGGGEPLFVLPTIGRPCRPGR